ncbi:hypothetical protein Tco_1085080, partial [Tanacetum coccineum]
MLTAKVCDQRWGATAMIRLHTIINGRSGTLVGQGSTAIVIVDMDYLLRAKFPRYYELDNNVYPVFLVDDDDDEMDLFAFINHADPTKVRIGEREVREGEHPLLDSTRGRVVPLAGVNEQGSQNDGVEDAGNQNDDDEVLATVVEKAKGSRKKRKATGGASGSSLPPKTLRADHEREGGGHTDSVTGPNLRTQHPSERFVVLSDSPCHSSSNIADAEVSSVVRSLVPDPPKMTTTVATTVVADTSSVPVPRAGNEPVHHTLFADSAFIGKSNPDVADMDSETLHQTYVPKWNVTNNSALDDTDVCRGVVDHLAPSVLFSQLHSMDYDQLLIEFNVRAARQTCLSSELSLKEAEVAKAIHLRGQYATVEAAEVARTNELNGLKERKSALEEEKSVLKSKVVALVSVDATKVIELASLTAQTAKLTQDLSELGLSYDEL